MRLIVTHCLIALVAICCCICEARRYNCTKSYFNPPIMFAISHDRTDPEYVLCANTFYAKNGTRVELTAAAHIGDEEHVIYEYILFNGSNCFANRVFSYQTGGVRKFVSESNTLSELFIAHPYSDISYLKTFDQVGAEEEPTRPEFQNASRLDFYTPCGGVVDSSATRIDLSDYKKSDAVSALCIWRLEHEDEKLVAMYNIQFKPSSKNQTIWILDGPNCAGSTLLYAHSSLEVKANRVISTSGPLTVIFAGFSDVREAMFSADITQIDRSSLTTAMTETIPETTASATTKPNDEHGLTTKPSPTHFAIFGLFYLATRWRL